MFTNDLAISAVSYDTLLMELTMTLTALRLRFVARVDDVGIGFSWLPERNGTVADGRRTVIEWTGVASGGGIAALRAARPAREWVYRVDAEDSDAWCWRADRPNRRASLTFNLANEWVAAATMTTRAFETGDVS